MNPTHFASLAAVLAASRPSVSLPAWQFLQRMEQWAATVHKVASYLSSTNANFHRQSFIDACFD